MGIRGIGSFLLVLSISAAFAAGCKGQENKTGEQETVKKYEQAKSPEDIKEQALDYLDGLYEDTFTVQSATAISWAENYETITVASERFYADDDEGTAKRGTSGILGASCRGKISVQCGIPVWDILLAIRGGQRL